jgi:hypothetical protein
MVDVALIVADIVDVTAAIRAILVDVTLVTPNIPAIVAQIAFVLMQISPVMVDIALVGGRGVLAHGKQTRCQQKHRSQ